MSKKNKKEVIAIACADIHLSAKAPIWRSAEPDWYAAMKRPLKEINNLQEEYDCPILCAGDIFDQWYGASRKEASELINFALKYLPDNMYCVPGQHDLPDHNYEDIGRSAYYTLVQAEKIQNVLPDVCIDNFLYDNIVLHGFPFGHKLKLLNKPNEEISIAIIHEYCWIKGHSYPGAPEENKFGKRKAGIDKNNKWLGYDIVIYGDNHKGFKHQIEDTTIFNCGTLMRRKSDEIGYKPQVGLIYSDGSVEPHYLDTSLDKHLDVSGLKDADTELDISSFIEELSKLGEAAFDFTAAMKQYFAKNKTNKNVKNVILKAMENRK